MHLTTPWRVAMRKLIMVLVVVLYSQLAGCASAVTKTVVAPTPTPEFASVCERELFAFNKLESKRNRTLIMLSDSMITQLVAAETKGINIGGFSDYFQVFHPSQECLAEKKLTSELQEKRALDESIRLGAQADAAAVEAKRIAIFFEVLTVLLGVGLVLSLIGYFEKK